MTHVETATTPIPKPPAPFSPEAEALGVEYGAALVLPGNIQSAIESLESQGKHAAAAVLIPALLDASENLMRLHRLAFPVIWQECELTLKAGN